MSTLCDPIDGSPPSLGFSRQEHWSGLPFSSPVHACMLSHFSCVWLCATLWTAARQAPLSTGFSRQEYWSGFPFPSLVYSNYSIVFIFTVCQWLSNLCLLNPVFYLELQMFAVYLHLDVPRASQIQLNKNRTCYLTSKSAFPAIFSVSVYSTTISQRYKPMFVFWPSPHLTPPNTLLVS